MKSFFPENAVEYFVSYYDYYQPEAYVPRTDTYIEKDSSINEQIDRMRHSATRALLERDDVIIVASVSCIYGIGSLETYQTMTFRLHKGAEGRPHHPAAPLRRAAVQAQRQRLPARHLPGARRHGRHLPGPLRGPGLAHRDVRRRDRIDRRVRSADRREDGDARRTSSSTPTATTSRRGRRCSRRSSRSRTSSRSGSTSSTAPAGCWRRSGWSSAPSSTSR